MSGSDTDRQRLEDLILALRCSADPADEDAWYELWGQYQGLVGWRAAQTLPVGIRHEAEDVTQEVFIRFRKAVLNYDPERGSLATFLAILARSTARDWEKSRRGERNRTVGLPETDNLSSNGGIEADPDILLAEGRKRLPLIRNLRKRQAFEAFLALKTPDEVHTTLGVPLSSAYRLYDQYREWLTDLADSVLPG